ncbi:MAG: DNA-binding protein [Anaerolineae bacterium]|nr:DNA-binding protein [Anaerolineae bacterium]
MKVEANEHAINKGHFVKLLLTWGQQNFREFPWRLTTDPYKILISEVMLHRTQAVQVVPVYENFVNQYPDILSLKEASKEELHTALFSLGLRWRIDLIYGMIVEIVGKWGGSVPLERDDLLALPGVSDYIANAVRCFSQNLPEPLADTNTVRIVGRLFGLEVKDSSRRNKRFRRLLELLIDHKQPRAYNYALLDLADKVCMKKRPPDCLHCPLLEMCRTGLTAMIRES